VTHNPLMSRERVVIPDRPTLTKAQKIAVWNRENGLCVLCGKPVPPTGPDVRYDHEDMRAISGNDRPSNIFATHERCHADKTAKHDAPRMAKTRGMEKLTKAKVRKAGGFRGWRLFNGTPVRREDR
jgi:5-methylcytosine-specific restriction endonuclease McrA